MPKFRRLTPTSLLLASTLALAACGGGDDAQKGGAGGGMGAPGQMPPPLVEAMTVRAQQVPNIVELPGRIQAVRTAEVRARTDGIIERRYYTEGTDVAAGTPLFRIDPRDYAAQVEAARAALARAQSQRVNAAQVVRRYAPLVGERAVSGQENDAAVASLRQADAAVAEARAALQRAQLQLSYTTVRAPIAGRVGRAQVTEGALVSAAQATLLTTVEQPSPVYAVFEQSNTALLNLMQADRSGQVELKRLPQVEVRLVLANGTEYGPVGRLDFADAVVDPQTGSQSLRAVFANGERLLLPGQFVRGRVSIGTTQGVLIPARAIQFAERGASVVVVGADGTTQPRPVQLSGQTATGWVVKSGLKPGERIVTDGWQKIMMPGMKVQVKGQQPAQGSPGGAPQQGAPAGKAG